MIVHVLFFPLVYDLYGLLTKQVVFIKVYKVPFMKADHSEKLDFRVILYDCAINLSD